MSSNGDWGSVGDYTSMFNDIMSGLGALFGSSNEQVGTGSSTTRTTGTTSIGRTSSQRTMQDADINTLRALANLFTQNSQGFSRGQAMQDSAGLQAAAVRGLREGALPQIATQERQSGAYSTTARKQLNNDAVNRASDSLAALRLQAISNYGQLQQSNLQGAAAAIAALRGAITTGEESSTTTVDQTAQTDSRQTVTQENEGLLGSIFG